MFHRHRPYIESHGRECCDKIPALKHVDESPCLDRGDERGLRPLRGFNMNDLLKAVVVNRKEN